MLHFGRSFCNNPSLAISHEWLVTNGIGGYASGTVANILTRRYHGLLIAALKPPLGRTLLLAKLDETLIYNAQRYPLHANHWVDDHDNHQGLFQLEKFHLEGTTPVWTFACADTLLEKRIWMEQGKNTTYIRYDLKRASGTVQLELKGLVNYRDHHGETYGNPWQMALEPNSNGVKITSGEGATPFYLLTDIGNYVEGHNWYQHYYLDEEVARGFTGKEDHLFIGDFEATLRSGDSVTIVASTEPNPELDGKETYAIRRAYEDKLIAQSQFKNANTVLQQLVLAADQFVVRRPLTDSAKSYTVIAGYPWFGDWGRDTMISLAGLTLPTGRHDIAKGILHTFARYVDQGMLPNQFPESGQQPEYNTVDATMWYFEAIRAYVEVTQDNDFLREIFPVLESIIEWHQKGTRYQIHVDPNDHLLYAGEAGVQLTWMDAKIGDWVVTPRTGKPIEINALWYNALKSMAEFASMISKDAKPYQENAKKVLASFERFWNADLGYCYDVVDSDDATLRPNQLIAASIHHSPLDKQQQKAVVDVCARQLWTSHGLRSLDPNHSAYAPAYTGDVRQRDSIYHQGTVWGWLIGPFISAHYRVYKDKTMAQSFLDSYLQHLQGGCIGNLSEIFDAEPPFTPRGAFAQAWSVAEALRVAAQIA